VIPLEALDLAFLGAMAFFTAVLSAVVGMAGGIVLLTVMLLYLDPLEAIPLHGVIQLFSNGSRALIQRKHVNVSLTWRYGLLLLPAGWLGLKVAFSMPPDFTKALIGGFVLLATWRPGWLMLGTHPENTRPTLRFTALGGATGFLSVVIGATGPLIAPFFLNLGLTRQALVGTKAMCQMLGHIAKTILFGAVGFAFAANWLPLALMSVLVVAGTWAGSQVLDRVNERTFTMLYRTVLTLVAVRLLVWEGYKWLAAGA